MIKNKFLISLIAIIVLSAAVFLINYIEVSISSSDINQTIETNQTNQPNVTGIYWSELNYSNEFYYSNFTWSEPNYSNEGYYQVTVGNASQFVFMECVNSTLQITDSKIICIKEILNET